MCPRGTHWLSGTQYWGVGDGVKAGAGRRKSFQYPQCPSTAKSQRPLPSPSLLSRPADRGILIQKRKAAGESFLERLPLQTGIPSLPQKPSSSLHRESPRPPPPPAHRPTHPHPPPHPGQQVRQSTEWPMRGLISASLLIGITCQGSPDLDKENLEEGKSCHSRQTEAKVNQVTDSTRETKPRVQRPQTGVFRRDRRHRNGKQENK